MPQNCSPAWPFRPFRPKTTPTVNQNRRLNTVEHTSFLFRPNRLTNQWNKPPSSSPPPLPPNLVQQGGSAVARIEAFGPFSEGGGRFDWSLFSKLHIQRTASVLACDFFSNTHSSGNHSTQSQMWFSPPHPLGSCPRTDRRTDATRRPGPIWHIFRPPWRCWKRCATKERRNCGVRGSVRGNQRANEAGLTPLSGRGEAWGFCLASLKLMCTLGLVLLLDAFRMDHNPKRDW